MLSCLHESFRACRHGPCNPLDLCDWRSPLVRCPMKDAHSQGQLMQAIVRQRLWSQDHAIRFMGSKPLIDVKKIEERRRRRVYKVRALRFLGLADDPYQVRERLGALARATK